MCRMCGRRGLFRSAISVGVTLSGLAILALFGAVALPDTFLGAKLCPIGPGYLSTPKRYRKWRNDPVGVCSQYGPPVEVTGLLSLGPYVSVLRPSTLPITTTQQRELALKKADLEIEIDAEADPNGLLASSCRRNEYGYCQVAVKLSGWRTIRDGAYGHMGTSKRNFLVGRVRSASALPPM